jgi:phosphoribosylglycinamide formyltransferase-1
MNFNSKIRLAFYVSGNASRLIKLIDLYPQIVENTFLVINDKAPNKILESLLKSLNIYYMEFCFKQKKLIGNKRNIYISDLLLSKFKEFKIDYSFCFGGKILNGKLLELYNNKIINFHPAILPLFPGEKSIDQALNCNTFLLGNTAHFIDKGIDTGPVIMQNIINRNSFKSYEDLLSMQLPMIYQIFCWLNENRLTIENDKVVIADADYTQPTFYPQLEINNNYKNNNNNE